MEKKQLIPEKYQQQDLFVCDVADAVLKDIMPHMEHPFYSLSKKPDTKIRRYEHNGNWLEIIPGIKGLATIYDKDILIFAISQIMAKIKNKEKVGQHIKISAREILQFTNRGTSGKDYSSLCDALDRLAGTRIKTNIICGEEEQTDFIGLVDAASIRRTNGLNGRLLWVELKLSDWVFDAIRENSVLTLHRDYFRLRKPIERRIYELARKHCGKQLTWSIGLQLLHKKSGSQGLLKKFRLNIRNLVKHDHLPDYSISFDEKKDKVIFTSRGVWWKEESDKFKLPIFTPDIFEEARLAAPNYDVYYLEQEYRNWFAKSERDPPHNLKAAFVGFCKGKHKRNPTP
jgi:plasmid replication initiation protein